MLSLADQLRKHDIGLPQWRTLLLVAMDEEQRMTDYIEKLGVRQSVGSTWLLEIGPRKRSGEDGLGLIEVYVNKVDLRAHFVRLTPKGRQLVKKLTEIMERGE